MALAKIVEAYPAKALLLKGSDMSGGGADPRSGMGCHGIKNPWKKESWNMTEQNKIIIENKARAKNLMIEAGIKPPPGF